MGSRIFLSRIELSPKISTEVVTIHDCHDSNVVLTCDSSVPLMSCEMDCSNADTSAFEQSISHEVDCVDTCSFYSQDFDIVDEVSLELHCSGEFVFDSIEWDDLLVTDDLKLKNIKRLDRLF